MPIIPVEAKSLLRKYKYADSWFCSRYGFNLFRGCSHGCVYCDGRNEKYRVNGNFDNDIEIKINAPSLLERELNPERKRKPLKKGFIVPGGGVGDLYQKTEKFTNIITEILEVIYKYKYPIHILTKSDSVLRDIEILKKINKSSKVIVSFSMSSTDNELSSLLEPGAPSPDKRFIAMQKLQSHGISSGICFMPVIPFITDTPIIFKKSLLDFYKIKPDYLLFSGLTLKTGRQKDYFYSFLNRNYPDLIDNYNAIYQDNIYGSPIENYINENHLNYSYLTSGINLYSRIPLKIFGSYINNNDKIAIVLEQMDYIKKCRGEKSPYGYASYRIKTMSEDIASIDKLTSIKGVGFHTAKIIREILETGNCKYYDDLIKM